MSRLVLRTAAIVLTLGMAGVSDAATLAHWRFENDFTDSSGNGHMAAAEGDVVFSSDVAATAPGSSSLELPLRSYVDTDFVPPSNDFTIEFFVRRSPGTPVKGDVLTTFDFTTTDGDPARAGFEFGMFGEGALRLGDAEASIDGPDLGDGEWHHVALTFSAGNRVQLYVDGEPHGPAHQRSGPLASFTNPIRMGAGHPSTVKNGPFLFWDGQIDEVRVSSGVLSPGEFLNAPQPEPEPALTSAAAEFGAASVHALATEYAGNEDAAQPGTGAGADGVATAVPSATALTMTGLVGLLLLTGSRAMRVR